MHRGHARREARRLLSEWSRGKRRFAGGAWVGIALALNPVTVSGAHGLFPETTSVEADPATQRLFGTRLLPLPSKLVVPLNEQPSGQVRSPRTWPRPFPGHAPPLSDWNRRLGRCFRAGLAATHATLHARELGLRLLTDVCEQVAMALPVLPLAEISLRK